MSHSMALATASRRIFVTLSTAVALIALTGCQQNLDMEAARKAVSDGLKQQTGLEIASVTCPSESRAMKAGDTFDCTATPKLGGSVSVKITQKDDQGNISWEVTKNTGLLDMRRLEASVKQGVAEQTGVEATVACGDPWQVGKAGDVFECEVTATDGAVSMAVVTVKDDEGNVSWKLESAETSDEASPEATTSESDQ